MACGRSAQNPVFPDKQLLNAIGSTDLSNQLHCFRVVVAPITSDDEGGAFCTFRDGEEDAGYEGLGVVWFLECCDFLAEAGSEGLVSRMFSVLCCC